MTNQSVILKITDRAIHMEIEEIIFSTDGYTIAPDNSGRCDLLICEITNENAEQHFNFIEKTMYSGMAGSLFLVSAATEPNILIQALKIGPKGFFQLPLKHDDVRSALLKLRTDGSAGKDGINSTPAKEGTIIYIIGSKGGVGTTTITVNLATELVSSQARNTVALIDMNLLFGDIPIFLDIQSPPFDWAEIARNIARLDSNFLMGTLFKHPSGLNVLPSPTGIFESFASGPDIITKLLALMKTMFDYIVIDGGQDLGEMSKAIMKIADRVVIVTLLNLPCLINVKRLRDAFLRLGYPSDDRVSVIANRVNKKTSNISVEDAERTTKKKITWTVPNDFQNTMDAINMGKT
ncbi:MAG: response regulator receiver protein, partial [Deltaproteobacteria bacterium]|nr:response regulator receiver protein [Deltaproteobacteria bacterium]